MSIIFDCTCATCGNDLSYSVRLDNDDDLRVQVEPCVKCLNTREEEVREEEREAYAELIQDMETE